MTMTSNGSMEGGLNGNGDAEFYIFAAPDENGAPVLDHVIYRVTGEQIANGLCNLLRKTQGQTPGGLCFRHVPAMAFSTEDQIIIDEVLDTLDRFSHPDPCVYAVKPSAELMQRAQYVARARTWERRLRDKMKAPEAPSLVTLAKEMVGAAMARGSGNPVDWPRVMGALQVLQAWAESQAGAAWQSAAGAVAPAGGEPNGEGRIREGRLEYRPDFCEVWVDGQRFDLTTRMPARRCLQFLVEKQAFDEASARDFAEIHAYVTEGFGSVANEPKIHDYFNEAKGKLPRLRRELIKAVARSRRYYLEVMRAG